MIQRERLHRKTMIQSRIFTIEFQRTVLKVRKEADPEEMK